jgi:hypothetical protein
VEILLSGPQTNSCANYILNVLTFLINAAVIGHHN